ncbi:hypothetical protein [Conexibacter sp. CPCC 206217]|uniref:hypothetical protein n=1 Tax=Conexibacter sp. CPCC 206217 TaxID=3064574 RepID=UPI0027229E11|nr:hypothetical protein [Conexibacter sp. CPCC 206217]MDO8214162.1 hypothetical protein [Conexibacter sp. CPCC 206217]
MPTDSGPMITARLSDGPLKGKSLETQIVEGRAPKVIDVPGGREGTCRYCLADHPQGGHSAQYEFLYVV